jgi:hypothetical protein
MYCSDSIKVVRLNPHAGFRPPGPDLEKFHPVMAGEQVFGRKKPLYLFHDFLIHLGGINKGSCIWPKSERVNNVNKIHITKNIGHRKAPESLRQRRLAKEM